MREQISLAAELQRFLEGQSWTFAFIGGIANLAWGEVRTTRDVDISLFTSFDQEELFVLPLLEEYKSRVPDPVDFAKRNRVLLLQDPHGIGIDIALAGFPFEMAALNRSKSVDFGHGVTLRVVSAEDLIVMKAFAGREQDWADVTGIVKRQSELDWAYIEPQIIALAEAIDDSGLLARLQAHRSQ
jgi:predicted nucleotidyltransferase